MKKFEAGSNTIEMLIVGAMLGIAGLAFVLFGGTSHATSRPASMVQVLGAVDIAHGRATAAGSAVTVAPATDGSGSVVTLYDAYTNGNVIQTITLADTIGMTCGGGSCGGGISKTFTVLVRRDGSCDVSTDGVNGIGASTMTVGVIDSDALVQAATWTSTDMHALMAGG